MSDHAGDRCFCGCWLTDHVDVRGGRVAFDEERQTIIPGGVVRCERCGRTCGFHGEIAQEVAKLIGMDEQHFRGAGNAE